MAFLGCFFVFHFDQIYCCVSLQVDEQDLTVDLFAETADILGNALNACGALRILVHNHDDERDIQVQRKALVLQVALANHML